MKREIDFVTRMIVVAGLGYASQGCGRVAGSESVANPIQEAVATQTITPPTELPPFSSVAPLPGSSETQVPEPFKFHGIDFSGTDPIAFNFEGISSFSTTTIVDTVANQCDKFIPGTGTSCEDIDHTSQDLDIIHTIHSGRDKALNPLEGEGLRRYFEGYEPDKKRAINTLPEIQSRMDALVGNKVIINQAGNSVEATVKGVYRLTPAETAEMEYTSDLIPEFQKTNPGMDSFIGDGKEEIFLWFCGWALPDEPNPDQNVWYSWSRYLIVIGTN